MSSITIPTNTQNPNTKYKLSIYTIQAPILKTIIESLKDILSDVPILCTPDGLEIFAPNSSKTVLVQAILDADKFNIYECPNNLLIGINILNLYKIIKTVDYNDILRIFITEDDPSKICIQFENTQNKTTTISYLHLLDLDNEEYDKNSPNYAININIDTLYLQKVCRDMSNFSDKIEIKVCKNQLILSCKGDFCERQISKNFNDNLTNQDDDDDSSNTEETELVNQQKNNDENLENNEIIQGNFNLKFLTLFTKCSSLSKTIQLHLENDFPLIIEYNHILGNLKFCLAPYYE